MGIEVKKLEPPAQGSVARDTGLDYNTTPPCARVRVQDAAGTPFDIRSFYLFVCLERAPDEPGAVVLTALCLVDDNSLNEDFQLYLSITGEREKRIGLATYGDGADRAQPMLIFANPLGVREFDRLPILIHSSDAVGRTARDLRLKYVLHRSLSKSTVRSFYCYRWHSDMPDDWAVSELWDPFPTPKRPLATRPRGRFKLPFHL